ncbi:MAG: SdpI family protein [Eubacterium sp.]|nr:SdpI family protein [Eubacterium sp.]
MGFWIYMLFMTIIIPITMVAFGKRFRKSAPDKINHLFGYRTKRSMMNRATWEFAHQHMGNLWFRWGSIICPVSVIAMLPTIGKSVDVVGTVGAIIIMVQLIPMFVSVAFTEKALKETFDDYGRRRL